MSRNGYINAIRVIKEGIYLKENEENTWKGSEEERKRRNMVITLHY